MFQAFFKTCLATSFLTGYVLALPLSLPGTMQAVWSLNDGETQCFTAHAAPTSDCRALLENPPAPDWTNVARAGAPPLFKLFCSGSCCLFTDTQNAPADDLVRAGNTLLGCAQPANGRVNGVTKTDAAGVCLADETGGDFCLLHLQ
ncbi:hypothetical protein GGX14DRAFT_659573 [Mycena pura]|uniref:Secreted protein n=1 Tax=Mycena pura TaxID=153505 RepID=A0AAD6YBJ0_9AGAR|nr:hypothetical protein GGX14DRAFT_659573 [Mycena pura]